MKNRTKIIPIAIVLLLASMLGPQLQSANAGGKSPYESGYDHGCDDADISDAGDRYINQPEKGPSFHTNEFMNEYHEGYNACSGSEDGNDNDKTYCDVPNPSNPCHDRRDVSETTGLATCMDGSHEEDWRDCEGGGSNNNDEQAEDGGCQTEDTYCDADEGCRSESVDCIDDRGFDEDDYNG